MERDSEKFKIEKLVEGKTGGDPIGFGIRLRCLVKLAEHVLKSPFREEVVIIDGNNVFLAPAEDYVLKGDVL